MSFATTLTAKCDTPECEASVSFATSIHDDCNKILKASGWTVDGYFTHTCPWCVDKGVKNNAYEHGEQR